MADLIERNLTIHELEAFKESCIANLLRMSYDDIINVVNGIPAVNRWIPCSERLPENRERVLVCFRSGTVHIAVWYGDYDEKGAWKVTSQFPTKLYRTDTIPKWMPMPEIPEPPEKE